MPKILLKNGFVEGNIFFTNAPSQFFYIKLQGIPISEDESGFLSLIISYILLHIYQDQDLNDKRKTVVHIFTPHSNPLYLHSLQDIGESTVG